MLLGKSVVGTISPMFGLPTCHAKFAKAYAKMLLFTAQYVCGPDQTVEVIEPEHSVHDLSRNQIAAQAVGEWTLMLDVDHEPPVDLVWRLYNLMRRCDAEVVSGYYPYRVWPYWPTVWKWRPGGGQDNMLLPDGEISEVDCVGAGCLMVKNRVFRRIAEELGEEPFSRSKYEQKGGFTGEDFAFCRRLQRLGIRPLVDPRIEVPHLEEVGRTVSKDMDVSQFGTREVPNRAVGRAA